MEMDSSSIVISDHCLYVLLEQYYSHTHMEKKHNNTLFDGLLYIMISLADTIINNNNYTVII